MYLMLFEHTISIAMALYLGLILSDQCRILEYQGPYSREDHLTLGFFRNFKMRNSVTAEFRKSLVSNYLRKTVVAEFRILIFMQNTPFFPRI